jgi:hypothetical protein
MNGVLIGIVSFSVGLVAGILFFACNTKAYDQDSQSQWLQLQQWETERRMQESELEQQRRLSDLERKNPC